MQTSAADGRFTVEIPVRFSRGVERAVLARLRVAQRLSNEVLGVFLDRADAYRRDPDLRRLRAERVVAIAEGRLEPVPYLAKPVAARRAKPVPEAVVPRRFSFNTAAERGRAWQDLRERHGLLGKSKASFSDAGRAWYDADALWVKSLTARHRDLGALGLGADVIHHEIVASGRERVMRWLAGDTGRPRFASRRRPRESISGSSSAKNGGSLRVDLAGGEVRWGAGRGAHPLVGRFGIDVAVDPYLRRALRDPVICVVRLLHRTVRGRRRWYVQLVLAGVPPLKPQHRVDPQRGGVVGLDLGVQQVAAVVVDDAGTVRDAWLADLAGTAAARERSRDRGVEERGNVRKRDRYVRRMQRRLSQRLARNPANAHAVATRTKVLRRTRDGRAVGKTVSVPAGFRKRVRLAKSAAVRAALAQIAEIRRVEAAARLTDHGRLANRVLAAGATVALEALSYRAWQRAHGRSTQRAGAGAFVERIVRRAPLFGASVVELPVGLRLSQLCHVCGAYTVQHRELAKPIAQRTSACACGREPAQRDLYSAFLAALAVEGTRVDCPAAQAAWDGGAVSLLESARRAYESGRLGPSSDGFACVSSAPGRQSLATIARHPTARRLRSASAAEPRATGVVEHLNDGQPSQGRSTANRRHDAAQSLAHVGGVRNGREQPLEACPGVPASVGLPAHAVATTERNERG